MRGSDLLRGAALFAAALAPSCGAPPAPVAAPCPEPAPAASAAASATASVSAAASAPAAPAYPRPLPLDVEHPRSPPVKLALSKLAVSLRPSTSVATFTREDGATWIVPRSVAPRGSVYLVEASGTVRVAWTSPRNATLLAAPAADGGLWIGASPPAITMFGFSRLERVFRLDKALRVAKDLAFGAGIFQARGAGSDGQGGLWLTGTLAGPLTLPTGTLAPPQGGRLQALVALSAAGAIEWAAPFVNGLSVRVSPPSVGPDGGAIVSTFSAASFEHTLHTFARDGALRWKKTIHSTADNILAAHQLGDPTTDGAGGSFLWGNAYPDSAFDLGKGALVGGARFAARLGSTGDAIWVRSLEGAESFTAAGGSLVALVRGETGHFELHEIDPSGAVARTYAVDVPEVCKKYGSVEESITLAPKQLVLVMTCQELTDSTRPPDPVGQPAVFLGRADRQ